MKYERIFVGMYMYIMSKHRHPSKEKRIDLQHKLNKNTVQYDKVNTVHASVIISMPAHHPEDTTDTLEQGNHTKNQRKRSSIHATSKYNVCTVNSTYTVVICTDL